MDFNTGKAQLVSLDRSNHTCAIEVKMDTYYLNGFKSRINRYVLTLGSF